MKTKKIGALRREIIDEDKKEYSLLFMTEGDIKSELRSKLRMIWRETARRVFMERIRHKNPEKGGSKWLVNCVECWRQMGLSEKEFVKLKNGTMSKKPKLAYEVDHVEGLPSLLDIKKDLGLYVHSLLFGELRILCRKCHGDRTAKQRKEGVKCQKQKKQKQKMKR